MKQMKICTLPKIPVEIKSAVSARKEEPKMNKEKIHSNLLHFLKGSAAEGVRLKQEYFDNMIKVCIAFNLYELITAFILHKGTYAKVTIGVYLVYIVLLCIYTTRVKNTGWYSSLYVSFCFITNCVYLPTLYLFGGAIDSGVPLLFICGGLLTILLMDNLHMLIMLIFSMGAFATAYYFDYHNPGYADQITDLGQNTYAEIPFTTIAVALGCGFVLRTLTIRLDDKQKKASELLAQIEEASNKDPLTGAYNRRFLMEYIDKCIEQTKSGDMRTFSLLMFDIDHFKSINDTYGHLAGDDCIESLASLLKSNLRKVDVVSRYGGEEFVCVLPSADETPAFRRAEQIRSSIEASQLSEDISDRVITVSGGVAMYEDGVTAQELINEADENLYIAKESGRNQIVWHQGGIPPLCYVVYDDETVKSSSNRNRRFTDHTSETNSTKNEKSS